MSKGVRSLGQNKFVVKRKARNTRLKPKNFFAWNMKQKIYK